MLFLASMQGRFCSNICILVWLYFIGTWVSQWPYLWEQSKTNVQRLRTFFGSFIRDKVWINFLLRPLLWVLNNSSYIWKANTHTLQIFWKNSISHHFPHTLNYLKTWKNFFWNFFIFWYRNTLKVHYRGSNLFLDKAYHKNKNLCKILFSNDI